MELILIAVIATFVAMHAVSVDMRLADIARRLESEERSTDRLSKVWWQAMFNRYGQVSQPETEEMRGSHR